MRRNYARTASIALFWWFYFYWELRTYSTPFSGACLVDFKQVNVRLTENGGKCLMGEKLQGLFANFILFVVTYTL